MRNCEFLCECAFLKNLEEEADLVDLFKTLYCLGDFSRCARHALALAHGREMVSDDILPNEAELVSLFAFRLSAPLC